MKKIMNISHIIMLAAVFNLAAANIEGDARADSRIKIVAFGDSLIAGYGLRRSAAFPIQLEHALRKDGLNVRVKNAGISGDTATGGLARLSWAVPKGTDAVILELGANDALRGVNPSKTRKSLERIVAKLKKRGIEILIAGMMAPEGMGSIYGKKFNSIYRDLARKYNTLHYPFFLEGVAFNQKLNQSDGIHPNATGVKIIVKKIKPAVLELIERVKAKQRSASTL